MSRLAMPHRRQRLAYERDGEPHHPHRAGAQPTPLRPRSGSKLKAALKGVLLAGLLVASGGGAFLSAHYFLASGERFGNARLSEVATLPPPSTPLERPEPAAATASVEKAPAAWTSVKITPEPVSTSPAPVAPTPVAATSPSPVVTPAPAAEPSPAPQIAAVPSVPQIAAVPSVPQLAAAPSAPAPDAVRRTLAPVLPKDEIESYLARGERMLSAGDVAAARLFFSRAAESGEPRGALAMARTFDPEVLRRLPVYGMQPNPEEAARWYAKAKDLGLTASAR
jgi:hypothetical protein